MDRQRFDWDEGNIRHILRHGVTPEEAEQVVELRPIEVDYQIRNGEERIQMIGLTLKVRLLSVVITFRSGKMRVITAFSATAAQRRSYFEVAGFQND
jgi:uncharacterized DUF497 family protein